MTSHPPSWAEALLRLVLPARHRDTVSGDLLEEYREHVCLARGIPGADRWYVKQVAGFLWRQQRLWIGLLTTATSVRLAADWLVPTSDFTTRSAISTWSSVLLIALIGFAASWRSRSLGASSSAALVTMTAAATLHLFIALGLLLAWHDHATMTRIAASGGLSEALTLPFVVIVPGIIIATIGGILAKVAGGLTPSAPRPS